MSEYNDHGPIRSEHKPSNEKVSRQEIIRGSKVRVNTGQRNDPTRETVYEFEELIDTQEGKKAKLSFRTHEGKRLVRIAHPDDLELA